MTVYWRWTGGRQEKQYKRYTLPQPCLAGVTLIRSELPGETSGRKERGEGGDITALWGKETK